MGSVRDEVVTPEALITCVSLLDRLERSGDGSGDEVAELRRLLRGQSPLPLARPITAAQQAAFRRSGWVQLRGLYDDWRAEMRRAALDIIDEPGSARHERTWAGFTGRAVRHDQSAHLSPALKAAALFGPAPRIARSLLGDAGELVMRGAAVFVKEAPTAYGSPWHADPVEPPGPVDRGVHVWVALDDGGPGSGALQLLPESRSWSDAERAARLDPERVARIDTGRHPLPEAGTVPGLRGREPSPVAPTFAAGDVLAFDSRIVHGAAGNLGPATFVSAATMWFAGDLSSNLSGDHGSG